jgi:hypothetical protein
VALAVWWQAVACTVSPPTAPTEIIPTFEVPAAEATSAPTLSPGQYILTLIPDCDGIVILEQPIALVWPKAEQRLKELETAQWGYYRCLQAPAEVSAYYQRETPRPPYNLRETVWVEVTEGTLGLYYHSAFQIWVYLWVLPDPDEAQSALVLVARANGLAFEPDC